MVKSKANVNDRQLVDADLNDTFSMREFDGYSLDDSIAFLQGAKKRYPDKVVILNIQGVPYESYEIYALYERRLENDEEFAQRLAQETQRAADQETRDRTQFEALSKRFGRGG